MCSSTVHIKREKSGRDCVRCSKGLDFRTKNKQ